MNKNNTIYTIDTSKPGYLEIKSKIEAFKGEKINSDKFNRLDGASRIDALKEFAAKSFFNKDKKISCLSVEHEDEHPSMGVDETNWRLNCFSCDAGFDIFDILGAMYGFRPFKDRYAKAVKLFVTAGGETTVKRYRTNRKSGSLDLKGIKKSDEDIWSLPKPMLSVILNPYHFKLDDPNLGDLNAYIKKFITEERGIDWEIAKQHHLRVWICDAIKSVYIIFPNDNGSYVRRNIRPTSNENKWWISREVPGDPKHPPLGIFNERAIKSGQIVFACESCFDALTVIQNGFPAVSLNSVQNFIKVVNSTMIPLFDNDRAGIEKAKELSTFYYVPKFLLGEDNDSVLLKYKDVNEAVHDPGLRDELQKIYDDAKKVYRL